MADVPGSSRHYPAELIQQLDDIRETVSNLTGSLSDLDKNKKRWIIIGIVLHSIVSPVLRKYIAANLGQLYVTLKSNHKIDTQQHPHQLSSYGTTYLNYEAINNNKTIKGKGKEKRYDYCVKDPVDLSKLFVQTHMVHYSAFDEGCDSSALLGIIIGTSPHAEASARQVRSEIRNPWAHCNFSNWDETKYTESFNLVNGLIRRLGLTNQEENQIFRQLYRLNRHGKMFVEGTSPEFVVLAEIKTQMQAMVKCMEQSLRAGQEMTASINRLEKRMEEHESSIPKHMNEIFQIRIRSWKEDEETFSVTRATESVAKLIETNNVVTVVGSSGSGKSSIIHHVALQLESVQKFELIPFVSSPVDIIQYRDMKKNQLFIIDDLCGKNYINENDLETWKKHTKEIEDLFSADPSSDQGKLKILVSCRLQIYKDKKFKISKLDIFTKEAVDLQSDDNCLLPDEKLKMIKHYMSISEDDWQEVNKHLKDCPFFPLLCKMSKGKQINHLDELFSSPIDYMRKDIKELIVGKPMENCALVLCVLFPDGFYDDFINPRTRPINVQQKITDISDTYEINLANERKRAELNEAFERLDGTYVKRIGPMYSIAHDIFYDIVAIEGAYGVTELYLKHAPSNLIAEKFRFCSIFDVNSNEFVIYVHENDENLYFDRIVQDLKQAKSYKPFFHNQQEHQEKYRRKVMEYIEQNKESCNELFCRLDREGMTEERKYRFRDDDDDTHTYHTSPVIEATKTRFYDLVQYFIQINCDCNKKDSYGNSPLYYSCLYGFEKVTDLLMRHGVEYRDELVDECELGEIDVVRVMADSGVDLSVCHSEFGLTPLTAACGLGQSEVVKLLLDKGADPLQTDRIGMTALDWARWREKEECNDTIINLLKSHMKQ